MNSSSQSDGGSSAKKIRKPYTITKSRESWTDEEHDKFLEALQLFDRDWKKIEDFVGSKTVIQIRSHAQKYFQKVQKNGTLAHVPPPRPKRKATHPYPQKASKNVLVPLEASIAYSSSLNTIVPPGYSPWEDTCLLLSPSSSKMAMSQDEFASILGTEADVASKGVSGSDLSMHGKQASVLHGIPDFAEVYSFIGSVFDPDTKGHVEKLKEMDPINFETVLLLMRNLTFNLCNPEFEPINKALSSSYDINAKTNGALSANRQTGDLPV